MYFAAALSLLSVLPAVLAEGFVLEAPLSRGYMDSLSTTAPCGGFNSITEREAWNPGNGTIQFSTPDATGTLTVSLSLSADPVAATDFQSAGVVLNAVPLNGVGEYCLVAATTNAYPLSQTPDGTNATLMFVYESTAHGRLYQCADVLLTTTDQHEAMVCNNSTTAVAGSTESTLTTPVKAAGSSTTAPASAAAGRAEIGLSALLVAPLLALAAGIML